VSRGSVHRLLANVTISVRVSCSMVVSTSKAMVLYCLVQGDHLVSETTDT